MRAVNALFALVLLVSAVPLAAQSGAPVAPAVAQMRDAATGGDLRSARLAAEAIIRDGGDRTATVEALFVLAQVEHAEGHPLRAADALDRAAAQAAANGDVVAQARALLDASLAYAAQGRSAQAASRAARLRPLLRSAVLPAELRAQVESRLNR